LRPSLTRFSTPSAFSVVLVHPLVSMVRCKNASGAPSDGDDSPPRRTEVARGKRVKIAAKKRKRNLTEAEIAQVVVDAAERGGRSSGIRIGESRFHLEGRQLGTEAT
jgi:hypothetical protein